VNFRPPRTLGISNGGINSDNQFTDSRATWLWPASAARSIPVLGPDASLALAVTEYGARRQRKESMALPRGRLRRPAARDVEEGCERIIRFAFDLALTRKRRKVTSVTKSNAQQFGMTLWDEVFSKVAADYPGVETEQWLVDAMAARFVLKPETLEVVVASNLFADILSDLGSALAGSMGIAASANLDPDGRFPSMFEPVHGSAPDIAGQGIANPIGAIWSAALMLDHLGLADEAARVMRALESTTASGTLTPDLGGCARTPQVTDAILAHL